MQIRRNLAAELHSTWESSVQFASTSSHQPETSLRRHGPRALHHRRLALLGTLLCVACGGAGGAGGGGGGGNPPPPPGGGNVNLPEGSTVAILETEAGAGTQFFLHGTFPVPPGTYPRGDGMQPFAVRDADGTLIETQTETVTRYAKSSDGADVVEVVAHVTRGAGVNPGDRVQYGVVSSPHTPRPTPGSPDVSDLQDGPVAVPTSVRNLLGNPASLRISARDCFDNLYTFFPLDGTGTAELQKYGSAEATLRVYDVLMPSPPKTGNQGTLPHLLGVHAYVTSMRESEVIGLDLRFNNGQNGSDGSTTADDPLGTVYFKSIEVRVPTGWSLEQDYEDPFYGSATSGGGYRHFPIVKPNQDGTLHVIRWQGQFNRRLVLVPTSKIAEGRAHLAAEGQAFCRRGVDPDGGHDYWSWWNLGTARYFPQRIQLPHLDYIGNGTVRNQLRGEYNTLANRMLSGMGTGIYPVASNRLGWGHPYGTAYGGQTGGNEVFVCDGVRTAVSASIQGYRMFTLFHRMHNDRQPTAFYDLDGTPTSVDTWKVDTGNPQNDYLPFEHYVVPKIVPGDPFGLSAAPQFQIQYVQGTGLEPSYQSEHFRYDPHDHQHLIRYTRAAKVLTWLGNDCLAKDDLLMQAENCHLSYHRYKNNQYGSKQGTGMRQDRDYVDTYPGTGFTYGRGEAWSLDCMNAAYSIGDDAWRARKLPWFQYLASLLDDGQAACSGFVQANIAPKFVNGLYRARQQIEQSIMENAFRGMVESVFDGADSGRTALMNSVLADSLDASISDMAWFPGRVGPWTYTGVGPLDLNKPVWCNKSQMPSNAYTGAIETYQNWSSFAYGYERTGRQAFLNYALTQINRGPNLLFELEQDGTSNIENRVALISLEQRLNNQL